MNIVSARIGIILVGILGVTFWLSTLMYNSYTRQQVTIEGVGEVYLQDVVGITTTLSAIHRPDKVEMMFYGHDGVERDIHFSDLGIELDLVDLRTKVENITLDSKQTVVTITPKYVLNVDKLNANINGINLLSATVERRWLSEDSQIFYDSSSKKYQISSSVQGNQLSAEGQIVLQKQIEKALMTGDYFIDLTTSGFYQSPQITQHNLNLQHNVAVLNEYCNRTITLDLGVGKTILIPPSEILSLMTSNFVEGSTSPKRLDKTEPFTLDQEALEFYVTSLNASVTTLGNSRLFVTQAGNEVRISQGDYGWWLNTAKTKEALAEALLTFDGEDKTVPVVWRQTAVSHDVGKDYGDTYVEISLADQHLWYIRNGEIILETDIVTGNPNKGWATPPGVYSLTYKKRNATLTGPGYSTPVDYWMPFNYGIGLHDATWQSRFGGTRYLTHGSHGCVNMPHSAAKELYSYLSSQFDPIIVY